MANTQTPSKPLPENPFRYIPILLWALTSGCAAITARSIADESQRDFFFNHTPDEQVSIFQDYDLETQYKTYITGTQIIHPPAIYLAREIARRGSSAVEFLRAHLENEKSEATIRDIVAVLCRMQGLRTYKVNKDSALMNAVIERTHAMQGICWKPITMEMVQEIQADAKKPPEE